MTQDHDDDARKRTDTREQDVADDIGEDAGEEIGGGEEDTSTDTVHHGEIVSADEDDRADRAIAINGDSDEVASLYADYEPEEAEELRQAVTEAKAVINTSAAEMGRALMRVKALVRHGNWEKWVALEFKLSKRSAQNLISLATVADTARGLFGADGENKVLALPQTVNYQVGDRYVPPDDQADIVERIVQGEFDSDDEILEAVRDAKDRAKAEKRSAKGSTDDDGGTRAKAKADEPKETAAERKKKRADAMRRASAYNLARILVVFNDEDDAAVADVDQVISLYGEIGSGPKHKMTADDHVMVSEMILALANAYMKSGIEAVEALKPVIPAEPVTKKSKSAVGGDD